MIDFSALPEKTLVDRGQYATVRAAHEDEKKRLSILCGQLNSTSAQILRAMQPDSGEPGSIDMLLAITKKALAEIESCAENIRSLATQRIELRKAAWGK